MTDDKIRNNRFGPSIPGFETDRKGNIVPEGTADKEEASLYHLPDDDELDDYSDDASVPRAWNTYMDSHAVARRSSFDDDSTKMLADTINARLRKANRQHQQSMEKPAMQGWKGGFNKALPFMKLKPSVDEKKQRKSEYRETVEKVYKSSIAHAHREVARAQLDIMATSERYMCPAVGVGSQKGGSGKTTTIVALAEFFARSLAWKQKKRHEQMKPAVIIDLNPDVGTVVNRVPDTINEYGNKLNTLELGQECLSRDLNDPDFNAMEFTFPTKWSYLRAVPNPVSKEDRASISRAKIEAIYDHIADKSCMFFMDNGTRIDSMQSISSANLSNAFVLVIDAGSSENFVISEVREYQAMASEYVPFKGISQRMVVAIVTKADTDAQRKNALTIRKKLSEENVASVIIPYEEKLADNSEIELMQLSTEYRASIAALAHHIVGHLNKS